MNTRPDFAMITPQAHELPELLARAYEVVHHGIDCPSIGGNGDADCKCDAVSFLRDLETALKARQGGCVMGDRTTDYNEGPIWQAFGLTRASYAVFPRRALQSMPWDWQKRMLDLINEMHDTLGSEAIDGNWTVQLRVGGKFVKDWRSDYRHTGPLPVFAAAENAREG